jgi:Tetratricopeptide repeat
MFCAASTGLNHSPATKYSEAERLYLEVAAAKRRVLGAGHGLTVATVVRLANMYRVLKRYDDAERQLLGAAQALTGDTDRATETAVFGGLAALYEAWGKPMQATEWRAKLPKEAVGDGERGPIRDLP